MCACISFCASGGCHGTPYRPVTASWPCLSGLADALIATRLMSIGLKSRSLHSPSSAMALHRVRLRTCRVCAPGAKMCTYSMTSIQAIAQLLRIALLSPLRRT